MDSIYLFDRNGSFLRTIGRIGNGPEEYTSILDITVDDSNSYVYVADFGDQKIVVYDFNGNFVNKIPYKMIGFHINQINDQIICSYLNMFGNESNKLTVLSVLGDSITSFDNHILFASRDNFAYSFIKSFQNYDKEVICRQSFNDTIFTYFPDEKTLKVRYLFDFGNEKLPIEYLGSNEDFNKKANAYSFLEDITETRKYIYTDIKRKGSRHKYIIDKELGQSFKADKRGVFVSDGGYYFWPKWCFGNSLVDYIPADYIMSHKDKVENRELKKIVERWDEESNPIIVVCQQD